MGITIPILFYYLILKMIIDPHYPKMILAFDYRGCQIEIERDELEGRKIYAAWVNCARGDAVAVPYASTSSEAVKKAKQWIDIKLGLAELS